jgi:phage terminase small subunit
MAKLNLKQARFVVEYLKDLNATQAAIRAGYSKKTAQEQSSRLLSNAMVAAAVTQATAKQLQKAELTIQGVLEAVRRVVMGDIRRLFDGHGNHIPIHKLSSEDAALVASVEYITKSAKVGNGHTDRVYKLRIKNHEKYVELAMKYFGLLKNEQEGHGVDWDKLAARLTSVRSEPALTYREYMERLEKSTKPALPPKQ